MEQLQPGTGVHNLTSGMKLSGDLNIPALERALTRVVEHQTALRSVFLTGADGEPRQRVLAAQEQRIPMVDLTGIPDESLKNKAYRIAWLEARAPFDLLNGPPIRVRLLKLRETDHILLFTMHHIISDGISMGLFADELAAFYEQELNGSRAEPPETTIEYGEYVEWQLTAVGSDQLQAQIDFWRKRLAGAPQLLELPSDRPRPREQSLAGGSIPGLLPANLMKAVRQACQREGVSPFCFLLASFVALLHRYSGAEDICVAVPVAGRKHVEVEKLIGLFVSLQVARIDLSGNPQFRDLLSRVQSALLDAEANQDVPFEILVEKLQPQRSMAYHPLVQVVATGLQKHLKSGRFGPLSATPYAVGTGASRFDLSSFFTEGTGDEYWWQTDYSTALFDDSRIERMRGHFERMALAAAENPEREIGNLPLLTSAEVEQFGRWNDTRASFPAACVHELVEQQARKTPQRSAVEFEGRVLTYSDLDSQADRLASRLATAGAGPGKLVAICLERSAEMVIGLLAILKTGAGYVPMDPAYPLERLSFMMRDASIRTLLTSRGLRRELETLAEEPVYVGEDQQQPLLPRPSRTEQDPDSVAYVIYTSGSTGQPKGVCVPHRAVVNLLCSIGREPGLEADDRLLAVATISFDIAGVEVFLPLITGATVVVAGAETTADGVKLLDTISRRAITVMQATPVTWRLLIEAGWTRERARFKVRSTGEALPPELAAQLVDRSDSVWNLYGPTETTIYSTVCRIERDQPVLIGTPIQNTQCHVLDRRMQPVPVGVSGELFIGGVGVAKGYLNRIELTNERFVPDIFSAGKGAIMYRTGDEVRRHANGELEYLRRLDSQVKLRGFRIELGEIETALTKQGAVQQAVVTVREDKPGDKRLVGYIVPRLGVQVRPAELQAALKATLPEYMIPFIVVVDAFPLTPNGKVDRKRLPAPGSLADNDGERVFPRDEIERKVAEIWEDVLSVRPIAIRDNFFDLGGHSLLGAQVISRLRRTFQVEVPLRALFEEPTVAELAVAVGKAKASGALLQTPLVAKPRTSPVHDKLFTRLKDLLH